MSREFSVVIERDEDGYFVASVPSLPGCHTQARSLDETLAQRGTPLDMALELKADENELIARMLRRATAERRPDDNPATIAERMDVYRKQTAPLLQYYANTNRLVTIDALGTPDEVFGRIKGTIESYPF